MRNIFCTKWMLSDYSNMLPTGLWAKRAILQPCHLSPHLALSGNPIPFSKLQEALERGVAGGKEDRVEPGTEATFNHEHLPSSSEKIFCNQVGFPEVGEQAGLEQIDLSLLLGTGFHLGPLALQGDLGTKNKGGGNYLTIQWLGLHAFIEHGFGELRFHKPPGVAKNKNK